MSQAQPESPALTAQQVFDKVAKHLLAQNARSLIGQRVQRTLTGESYPMCAYRGTDGRKCAAGCLILDAAYSPELEGKRVGVLPAAVFEPGVSEHMGMVAELQVIHDNYVPNDWAYQLRLVAKAFGLSPEAVQP